MFLAPGQSRVRAAALQVSLVDHLKDIALGQYSLQAILDHAEEVLPGFTKLNLESALNIIHNIKDERRFMAEHWLETSPEYLKEIVYAVEYARRSQVLTPTFNLGDIDYKPVEYSHISKCIYKLLNRKRGQVEFNQRCREYFGFSFQPQGTQLQIILESRTPIEWLTVPGYEKPQEASEPKKGPLDQVTGPEDPRIREIAEFIAKGSGKYTTEHVAYRFSGIPRPKLDKLLARAEEVGLIYHDTEERWFKR